MKIVSIERPTVFVEGVTILHNLHGFGWYRDQEYGVRELFRTDQWRKFAEHPPTIKVLLVDRKGFTSPVGPVNASTHRLEVPMRVGSHFEPLPFYRTGEIRDGRVVFQEE